jgi:hypothetical protein
MSKKKDSPDGIARSPLFNDDLPSTIHPEKLEFSRFSELQKSESSAKTGKILVYIFIVIALGVGAALIVRGTIINNNNPATTNTSSTTADTAATKTTEVANSNGIKLDIVAKSDSTVSNLPKKEDFRDNANLALGDSSVESSALNINSIHYQKLTSFSRITFNISGNEGKLPLVNLAYSPVEKSLKVFFGSMAKFTDEVKKSVSVDGFVNNMTFNEATNSMEIYLKEAFKYRIASLSGNLVIDLISQKELDKLNTITNTTDNTQNNTVISNSSNTNSSTDTNKPAAPFYENSFSQNKQYISSAVKDNSISQDNYWVWDQGSFFEISFGQSNKLGDEFVPNAVAYFDKSNTQKTILVLEVSNLEQPVLITKKTLTAADITNKTGLSLAGANFISVELISFEKGVAKYHFELKNKADYKLLTQDTYDGTTQILSLQLKD